MKVGELRAALGEYDDEMEVVFCKSEFHELHDLGDITVERRTTGFATSDPITQDVIVLDTGVCGSW